MSKQTFKKLTAVLLTVLLLVSSLPITAFAAELQQDGDVYSVNMPASGSDTLDLTDKTDGFTFKVYDDGGSDESYSNYCDGTLLITAPEGFVLKISGTGYTEGGYDFLYIYDGDTSVSLGNEKYSGSFTVQEEYSSANVVKVRFTSDGSYAYDGFELDITLIDLSTVSTVTYSYAGSEKRLLTSDGTQITLAAFADLFTAPEGSTFTGWLLDDTTYAEGETFTVNGHVLFTALVEEPQVVFGNDTDGWYANMPKTGTVTADLTDRQSGFTMHVYDDGGADAYYSDSCSGYLRIVAPANFVLKVSGSGRSESTTYDWLTIYDGDTTTVLGSEKYAGRPFTVPELTTTGNVLKLYFRSDTSSTYDGFDLTVTMIDYSNYSRVAYSYDGTAKDSFIENGTNIELPTFTSLFTLPERHHFTAWQSGGADYQEGDAYTVNGDVTFTALVEEDPAVMEDGEGGYYSLLPKTGTITADLSAWSAGDTLKVYDNGGKDNPYSYSCDGYLRIVAPEGYRLSVNGTYSTYNGYDWMYLYDGDTSTQLGPKFMGYNKTMYDYYTTGNVLLVYLYSHYGDNYSGCDLNVTVVDPDDLVTVSFAAGEGSGEMPPMQALTGARIVLPECGFTLPDKTYFDYYTDGTNNYSAGSVYTVTGNAALTAVYIEKIIATYKFGEQTATAEYRKGTRRDLPYFTEYFTLPYRTEFYRWTSGENEYYETQSYTFNEDVTFTAMLNDLPILIEKDDGTYYATLPKNEHVQANLSTGYANGFTFKLYDNGNENGYYAYNCDGSLTFTAPAGYIFLLSGNIVTEEGYDVLSIYDSDLTTLLGGQTYSGYNTSFGPLQTSSNKLKVHFASDSIGTDPGFAMTVRMIDPSSLITVTFDAGEGSGEMDSLSQLAGEAFTLPDYGFTAPEGKIFNGYSDGTNVYWPGTVTFNESKNLTAQWVDATGITYSCNGSDKALRYAKGSTVTLPALTDLFTLPSGTHFVGWQEKFSGDLYQAGDPYVANDPTVMTAVLEILYEDGSGGYYALMPVNNPNDNLTLDLSEKASGFSFTLYDDGGADGNYCDSNDGVLIVKAPENMVVTVTGSGQAESNYDYLRFYDGASATNSEILGNSKISGNFSIDDDDPLMSTGNYLRIYFHSDSSYNYAGFALTITVMAQVTVTYEFDGETKTVAVQDDSTINLAYFGLLFTSETKEFLYWQNGDDTYSAGDEYLVDGDVTFTAVTRLKPTVILDGNGATVLASIGGDGVATTLGPIPYYTGSTEPLPHAIIAFDIPEGRYFGGWECGGKVYAPGDEFTITEDVTFTAIWRDATAWELLNDSLQTSGTITLTEDVSAVIGSLPLTVPEGVTATIDLNGYTLDGARAAETDGDMILVYGDLTLTDSAASGAFTGGGVTVYNGGVFTADDSVAAMFAATVTQRYRANDDDYNYENYIYSVSWYPTIAGAMNAAAATPYYADSITLPEGWTFRWYLMPKVTLLQNVTVAEGETLEIDTDEGIDLDLNGHTFDVQGTFTGGTSYWRYNDGDLEEVFNPTDVSIDSTTPGVFRSSGTIGVNLQPWSADTYYFTGGTVGGFLGADGGTFHISGGHFTDLVMFNNGNDEASLEIDLSGDAEFDRLEHMIYSDPDSSEIHMTISDNVRIGTMVFDIMGDYVVNYPVLTVNGGYFTVDPRTWLDTEGAGENAVQILATPEQYSGQADWAADSDTYTWRVKQVFTGHSLSLNGDIGVNFYVDLTEEQAASAAVTFTWMKNGAEKTASVDLKDAERYSCGYKATCYVSASDMDADITATVSVDGVQIGGTDTYSVARYADVILTNNEFADYYTALETGNGRNGEQRLTDLRALVSAMLVYGDNAKAYFDQNASAAEPASTADIPETGCTETDLPEGVSFEGATLSLRSKTTLSLYFVKEAGAPDIELSMDDKTEGVDYELAQNGNEFVIRIRNIAAAELDNFFTVKVNGTGTVTYSPMTYCYKAANSETASGKLKNTVKALYNYWLAAETFFV